MSEVRTIRLDLSRVGDRMIFKVSSLDEAGADIAVEGWHMAEHSNSRPEALEEAQKLAAEWCRQHGLASFTTLDHRVP